MDDIPPSPRLSLTDNRRRGQPYLKSFEVIVAPEGNHSHHADVLGLVTLISADQALKDAATAGGLAVDDPTLGP